MEQTVLDFLHTHDRQELTISVADKSLDIPGFGSVAFPLDEFTSYCLLNGIDAMGYLLKQADSIGAFEKTRSKQLCPE